MKIEGKVKANGWKTISDLDPGDVFIYENDEETIYLRVDYGIVNLIDNAFIDENYDSDIENLPVRKITAKLVVSN